MGETAVKLHETFKYPNFPDGVRDLLSSPKGLRFRSKLPAVVKGFPLLKAEQLPGWEVTPSRPCKAVTTAELCFITDYKNELGSIQTFL